jgi:chromosome segregation ATPase
MVAKKKKSAKRSARPRRAAKRARPKAAVKPKRAAKPARAAAGRKTIAALEAEVRRLRMARGKLEHRLTAAVQEIGTLRQFEVRAQALERELAAMREELSQRLGGASIVSAVP